MSKNPLNLLLRFCLEFAGLFAVGYWGWTSSTSAFRYIMVITLPLLFAAIWGLFNVPNDPSRSGKAPIPVPGLIRLLLEWGLFASSIFCVYASGLPGWAVIFGGLVLFHYIISYDRVIWLLNR